jgi:hypothetical protein
MNEAEFVRILTLWFVVLIFLRMPSGSNGPVSMAVGVVSLVLLWALPLYVLVNLSAALLDR